MKIAALDMDGTVYVDEEITPACRDAIAAWRAAGNLAVSPRANQFPVLVAP